MNAKLVTFESLKRLKTIKKLRKKKINAQRHWTTSLPASSAPGVQCLKIGPLKLTKYYIILYLAQLCVNTCPT